MSDQGGQRLGDSPTILGSDQHRALKGPSVSEERFVAVTNSGWEVTGWPVMTLRRGKVVYENGEILAGPGSGEPPDRNPSLDRTGRKKQPQIASTTRPGFVGEGGAVLAR